MIKVDPSVSDWRQSRRGGQNIECARVTVSGWRKSSQSGQSGQCVEVAVAKAEPPAEVKARVASVASA